MKHTNYLGYCDEYWWPSFQAHGRVVKQYPELKAESLENHGDGKVKLEMW